MNTLHRATLAALAAALALASPVVLAQSKTFRWSSQGDILTLDPHSQNEGLNNSMADHLYEPLVTRGKTMGLEPCLAVSWSAVNPNTMRFKLRDKVTFHNGAPFTADDVVFSVQRALEKTSDFSAFMNGIKEAKRIDALTVDVITSVPTPTLLDQLTEVRIMNKAWAEKFNLQRPQDFRNKEETYGARNANGTGPYLLKTREPDVKTVLVTNSNWWGKHEGSINEVAYIPIKQNATRMAALITGEVDFVLDPPPEDISRLKQNAKIKVLEGNENRTIFLNFDQGRSELLYSNVKGKNPFKDLRVRQAMAHAIDADAIRTTVMRGQAVTSMSMIAPQVRGYTKDVEKRWPLDLAKAKKLMAEAGYQNGFEFTLDCPNNRYINDERICVAVAGMLAKIDIKVKVNAMPRAVWLPKIQTMDTSAYLLGWGVPTFDSLYTLQSIMRTRGTGGDGNWNFSGYSNARLDTLVDQLKIEADPKKRAELTREALLIDQADVGHIPLHHQVIPWAMRANVTAVHRADNRLLAKWVVMK